MQLERVRPLVIRMTLHAYEATALITAARWVAESAENNLPDEALTRPNSLPTPTKAAVLPPLSSLVVSLKGSTTPVSRLAN